MRAITKGPEPAALRAYRATPGALYDGKDFSAKQGEAPSVKDEIRGALLRDQLAICCYCMRRISAESRPHPKGPHLPSVVQMKIEHWHPQSEPPDLQLAWTNLLGACLGGEGSARSDQTCDTRKGEDRITLNPLNPGHVATLRCSGEGKISSTDPRLQEDIDSRLGLNTEILVQERRAHLERALRRLEAMNPGGSYSIRSLRALIEEAESPREGRLGALAGVLRLWARRRYSNAGF